VKHKHFFSALAEWYELVSHGADPIEAMHGHLCGPRCWHWDALPEERKVELMKAPWNQVKS
jgi:hypothetical protein